MTTEPADRQLPPPDEIEAVYRKIRLAYLYAVVFSFGMAAVGYVLDISLWWVAGVIFVFELFATPLLLRTIRRQIDAQIEESRRQMQAAGNTVYPDVGV